MNLNYSPWKTKFSSSSSGQFAVCLSVSSCLMDDYFQVGPCHTDSSALCAVAVCRLRNSLCTCIT